MTAEVQFLTGWLGDTRRAQDRGVQEVEVVVVVLAADVAAIPEERVARLRDEPPGLRQPLCALK